MSGRAYDDNTCIIIISNVCLVVKLCEAIAGVVTLCGLNEGSRLAVVVAEDTIVAHYRLEVIDGCAVLLDSHVVDASAYGVVPFGISEHGDATG